MQSPSTLEKIVEEIISEMSVTHKAHVASTLERDLTQYHLGWGRDIQKKYNLWRDKALLEQLGADHPDAVSGIIIKAVWRRLNNSGESD